MNVVPQQPAEDRVRFWTQWGPFLGTWFGPLPVPWGERIDVELTIRDHCRWTLIDEAVSTFEVAEEANRMSAVVEAVGEDGVTTLRLGDGVTLLDSEDPPWDLVGGAIRLDAVEVEVYPTGI